MSYQAGFDDAIKYALELMDELLYDWEGEESIDTVDVKKIVTMLNRAKPN